MTREQEINLIADCAVPDDKYKEFRDGIIWGAKWADKTMIDKACRWLDQQLFIKYDSDAVTKFINNFRKAMEK